VQLRQVFYDASSCSNIDRCGTSRLFGSNSAVDKHTCVYGVGRKSLRCLQVEQTSAGHVARRGSSGCASTEHTS